MTNNYQTLNPIGVENESETRQITVFQAPPTVDQAKSDNLHKNKAHTHINQSLINFLERPQLIASGSWGTSSARGDVFMYFDPLRSILAKPHYASKLSGFQFFRTSNRVRIQVTGNAFLSGKLRAVWVPRNRVHTFTSGICTPTMITGIVQGVDIYPTENATYELDIPMLWPSEWYDVSSLKYTWADDDNSIVTNGIVVIYVLSPLISEDVTDTCAVTVYGMNTNMELADVYSAADFPTVDATINYVPAPLLWYNMTSTGYPAVTDIVDHLLDPPPPVPTEMFYNAGETRVGTTNDEGDIASRSGTLSSYAATVSSLSAALTPFLPSFAPLTMAVSATASGLSSIFKFFKLDKPVVEQLPIQVQNRWKDLTHTDGGDTTTKLSVLSSNSLCPVGIHQPFKEADLSISSICSIPQLIYSRSVTTATPVSTRICNWVVCPSNVCINPVQGDYYNLFHTNASFLASAFEYWRGDCVFTIEVVAQGFSKMALSVSWFPGREDPPYTNQTASLSPDAYTSVYSKIINVSGNTKATFKVPYLTQNYACSANYVVKGFSGYQFLSREQFINGYITISVVNPLTNFSPTSPDNNSVDILLYQHWENLSFYKPCSYKMCNYKGKVFPGVSDWATPAPPGSQLEEMYHNSGIVEPGDDFVCDTLNPSQFFGESSDSLLDLIRRPSYYGSITANPFNLINGTISTAFSFFKSPNLVSPSASNERWNHVVPHDGQPAQHFVSPGSFMSYISTLFLTARGDVTYNLVTPSVGDPSVAVDEYPVLLANCMIGSVPSNNTFSEYLSVIPTLSQKGTSPSYYGGGSYYRPAANSQNPPCVTIPYYTPANFSYTPDCYTPPVGNPFAKLWDNCRMPGLQMISKADPNEVYDFLISAADNFTFGGYYPVPALNYAITSKSIGGITYAPL